MIIEITKQKITFIPSTSNGFNPGMFVLLLLFFVYVYVLSHVQGDETCTLKLEEAVLRPKSCGLEYFEKPSCELSAKILQMGPINSGQLSQLCLQFSEGNQVDLSILNVDGIVLCTMKNPTANSYTLIGKSLLFRSPNDRRLLYLNYEPDTQHLPCHLLRVQTWMQLESYTFTII